MNNKHKPRYWLLISLLLAAILLLAACAAEAPATLPEQTPPVEETPVETEADAPWDSEFSLLGPGIELKLGPQQGQFPWGNDLSYQLLDSYQGDFAAVVYQDMDCAGLLLSYSRNEEDGNEYLLQAQATRSDLTTPRAISVGMSEAELLAAYPEGLYHATIATDPYSAGHFCLYDEWYGYRPEWAFCFHLVYYLYEDVITGIELFDLMDGQAFTSPGEETVPEQESGITPSRWVYIGCHTLKEYADPAAATGLDGAYATSFQSTLAKHFLADQPRFLTLMAQAEQEAQDQAARRLAGYLLYYTDPPWQNELSDLDAQQTTALELILSYMEQYREQAS